MKGKKMGAVREVKGVNKRGKKLRPEENKSNCPPRLTEKKEKKESPGGGGVVLFGEQRVRKSSEGIT